MNSISGTFSGKWVLVDFLNREQPGLLSIGDTTFHGASVRKNLDANGRELLVDRIRIVSETGVGIDETVERRGDVFRVVVEPILAPASCRLVAVRAVYKFQGEKLPPRPVVGALEWLIWDNGGIETVWSDDMFTLYEISRAGAASPTGDMNQWVNSLIAPEDRARMKLTIDAGIKESSGERYFVSYRIITRSGTTNPGTKCLEVSASSSQDPSLPLRRLTAVAREVPALIPAINPEFGDIGVLMRAVFELSVHHALAAVDVQHWQTFMTSDSWATLGILTPQYGCLPHVIHPDDFQRFREAVYADELKPVKVRFLHTSGNYRTYEVTTSSGSHGPGEPAYVICEIRDLPKTHQR